MKKLKNVLLLSTIGMMSMLTATGIFAKDNQSNLETTDVVNLDRKRNLLNLPGTGEKTNYLASNSLFFMQEYLHSSEFLSTDLDLKIPVLTLAFKVTDAYTFGFMDMHVDGFIQVVVTFKDADNLVLDYSNFKSSNGFYYCTINVNVAGGDAIESIYLYAVEDSNVDRPVKHADIYYFSSIMLYEGTDVPKTSYFSTATKKLLNEEFYYNSDEDWFAPVILHATTLDEEQWWPSANPNTVTIAFKVSSSSGYSDFGFSGLFESSSDGETEWNGSFSENNGWYYIKINKSVTGLGIKHFSIRYNVSGTPSYLSLGSMKGFMIYSGSDLPTDEFFGNTQLTSNGPFMSGASTSYVTDVDNPITVDDIKSKLIAYDETDGDVSDSIIVKSDEYTGNEKKLGTYQVQFASYDSSRNESLFNVTIKVEDKTNPVIEGPGTLEFSYTTKKTNEEILPSYSAHDNYDESVDVSITSNSYIGHENEVGTYQMILTSKDSSNNVATRSITIKVIDDIAPVFTGEKAISKQSGVVLTASDIIKKLKATDAIDGEREIKIEEDNYSGHGSEVGEYTLKVYALDKSNNKATFTVTITVSDTLPPVWYAPTTIIHVQNTITLSQQDIFDIMLETKELDPGYASISLASDYVFSNEMTEDTPLNPVGKYPVRINARYFDGREVTLDRQIEVYETDDPIKEEENWFIKMCKTIYNWPIRNFGNFWIWLYNTIFHQNAGYLENI